MKQNPNPPPETKADPGKAFFVSVYDATRNRHGFLAGPYSTFGEAKAKQAKATKAAEPGDLFNQYAYGVCQTDADTKTLFGVL